MKLLERALSTPLQPPHRGGLYSPDELELAVAWMQDRVRVSQIAKVLGQPLNTTTYAFLARALRAASRSGLIGARSRRKADKQKKSSTRTVNSDSPDSETRDGGAK